MKIRAGQRLLISFIYVFQLFFSNYSLRRQQKRKAQAVTNQPGSVIKLLSENSGIKINLKTEPVDDNDGVRMSEKKSAEFVVFCH